MCVYVCVREVMFALSVQYTGFGLCVCVCMSVHLASHAQDNKFNVNVTGDDHVSFNILNLVLSPDPRYLLVSTGTTSKSYAHTHTHTHALTLVLLTHTFAQRCYLTRTHTPYTHTHNTTPTHSHSANHCTTRQGSPHALPSCQWVPRAQLLWRCQ